MDLLAQDLCKSNLLIANLNNRARDVSSRLDGAISQLSQQLSKISHSIGTPKDESINKEENANQLVQKKSEDSTSTDQDLSLVDTFQKIIQLTEKKVSLYSNSYAEAVRIKTHVEQMKNLVENELGRISDYLSSTAAYELIQRIEAIENNIPSSELKELIESQQSQLNLSRFQENDTKLEPHFSIDAENNIIEPKSVVHQQLHAIYASDGDADEEESISDDSLSEFDEISLLNFDEEEISFTGDASEAKPESQQFQPTGEYDSKYSQASKPNEKADTIPDTQQYELLDLISDVGNKRAHRHARGALSVVRHNKLDNDSDEDYQLVNTSQNEIFHQNQLKLIKLLTDLGMNRNQDMVLPKYIEFYGGDPQDALEQLLNIDSLDFLEYFLDKRLISISTRNSSPVKRGKRGRRPKTPQTPIDMSRNTDTDSETEKVLFLGETPLSSDIKPNSVNNSSGTNIIRSLNKTPSIDEAKRAGISPTQFYQPVDFPKNRVRIGRPPGSYKIKRDPVTGQPVGKPNYKYSHEMYLKRKMKALNSSDSSNSNSSPISRQRRGRVKHVQARAQSMDSITNGKVDQATDAFEIAEAKSFSRSSTQEKAGTLESLANEYNSEDDVSLSRQVQMPVDEKDLSADKKINDFGFSNGQMQIDQAKLLDKEDLKSDVHSSEPETTDRANTILVANTNQQETQEDSRIENEHEKVDDITNRHALSDSELYNLADDIEKELEEAQNSQNLPSPKEEDSEKENTIKEETEYSKDDISIGDFSFQADDNSKMDSLEDLIEHNTEAANSDDHDYRNDRDDSVDIIAEVKTESQENIQSDPLKSREPSVEYGDILNEDLNKPMHADNPEHNSSEVLQPDTHNSPLSEIDSQKADIPTEEGSIMHKAESDSIDSSTYNSENTASNKSENSQDASLDNHEKNSSNDTQANNTFLATSMNNYETKADLAEIPRPSKDSMDPSINTESTISKAIEIKPNEDNRSEVVEDTKIAGPFISPSYPVVISYPGSKSQSPVLDEEDNCKPLEKMAPEPECFSNDSSLGSQQINSQNSFEPKDGVEGCIDATIENPNEDMLEFQIDPELLYHTTLSKSESSESSKVDPKEVEISEDRTVEEGARMLSPAKQDPLESDISQNTNIQYDNNLNLGHSNDEKEEDSQADKPDNKTKASIPINNKFSNQTEESPFASLALEKSEPNQEIEPAVNEESSAENNFSAKESEFVLAEDAELKTETRIESQNENFNQDDKKRPSNQTSQYTTDLASDHGILTKSDHEKEKLPVDQNSNHFPEPVSTEVSTQKAELAQPHENNILNQKSASEAEVEPEPTDSKSFIESTKNQEFEASKTLEPADGVQTDDKVSNDGPTVTAEPELFTKSKKRKAEVQVEIRKSKRQAARLASSTTPNPPTTDDTSASKEQKIKKEIVIKEEPGETKKSTDKSSVTKRITRSKTPPAKIKKEKGATTVATATESKAIKPEKSSTKRGKSKEPQGSTTIGSRRGRPPKSKPSNESFCFCRRAEIAGDTMIACDNEKCKYKWFHFSCLNLTETPTSDSWYCPDCSKEASSSSNSSTKKIKKARK